MSISIAPFLPQPIVGVPYNGTVTGRFVGGATGSITFDVYTGGAGVPGSGASVTAAAQTLRTRGRAYTFAAGPGSLSNVVPIAIGMTSFGVRGSADGSAPQPPYNAGFGQIYFTSQALIPSAVSKVTSSASMTSTLAVKYSPRFSLSGLYDLRESIMATTPYQLSGSLNLTSNLTLPPWRVNLANSMRATSSLTERATWFLGSSASASDSVAVWLKSLVGVADTATLVDAIADELLARLTASAAASSHITQWETIVRAIADRIVASSAPYQTAHSIVALTAAVNVASVLTDALLQKAQSVAAFTSTVADTAAHVASLVASWAASGTATPHALLFGVVGDEAYATDDVFSIAHILNLLEDGAQIGMTLYTGQDVYTAWVMTPQSRAMRSYTNYPFNSYAQFGGQLYGASPAGISLLDGDNDDGTAIIGSLRTGLLDFGMRQLKRVEKAYIGYSSDGTLCMRVSGTSPEGEEIDYLYRMVPKPASAPRETSAKIGKGIKSVYWEFVLDNSADGADFTLYDVVVLPMILSRRVS